MGLGGWAEDRWVGGWVPSNRSWLSTLIRGLGEPVYSRGRSSGVATAAGSVLLSALHGRQSSPCSTHPSTTTTLRRPLPLLRLFSTSILSVSLSRTTFPPSPRPPPLSRASTKKPTLKIGGTDHGHCCQMPRAFAFSRRFVEK